jgi:site-specific DNA recombinase
LTASISKGRNKYYSYYHCSAGCKFRINADIVNKIFADHLKKYIPIPEIKPLYAAVIAEHYREETKEMLDSEEKATSQIKNYESRLIRARDLLATGEIDPSDYREMKSDYSEMIYKLQSKLTNIHIDKDNVEEMLQDSIENVMKLSECYDSGAWAESRDLLVQFSLKISQLK